MKRKHNAPAGEMAHQPRFWIDGGDPRQLDLQEQFEQTDERRAAFVAQEVANNDAVIASVMAMAEQPAQNAASSVFDSGRFFCPDCGFTLKPSPDNPEDFWCFHCKPARCVFMTG